MSYAEAAAATIEAWVANNYSNDSSFRWFDRTPSTDWHYSVPAWIVAISEIQADFEQRIGFEISFSPAEKRKTADYKMMNTYVVLVRKAETADPHGRTVLKALAQ